jgi:hypothetical protein
LIGPSRFDRGCSRESKEILLDTAKQRDTEAIIGPDRTPHIQVLARDGFDTFGTAGLP